MYSAYLSAALAAERQHQLSEQAAAAFAVQQARAGNRHRTAGRRPRRKLRWVTTRRARSSRSEAPALTELPAFDEVPALTQVPALIEAAQCPASVR